MNEFVNWNTLGTYAGAVMMVALITQFVKQIKILEKVNSQIISYVIAVLILIGANAFADGNNLVTAQGIILCFINAVMVALAANGAYDATTTGLEKIKKEDDDKYIHEEE